MANNMVKHIPNAVTCMNLLSGCIGIYFAFQGDFQTVLYFVLASGLFDLFDGMIARILKVHSPMGRELDSLADVVSFGFLPGVVYFMLLRNAFPENTWLPFAGFIVTLFSAIRLAKFNLDERQTTDFIGLNTPMNTFYVMSLPFLAGNIEQPAIAQLFSSPYFLFASLLLTSLLLVSEYRLFSMKFKNLGWADNKYKYMFLLVSAGLLIGVQLLALPIILMLYFLFSRLHFSKVAA
jgi:CDP-diacylglycerol--serine O-phosphatidyltransferase